MTTKEAQPNSSEGTKPVSYTVALVRAGFPIVEAVRRVLLREIDTFTLPTEPSGPIKDHLENLKDAIEVFPK